MIKRFISGAEAFVCFLLRAFSNVLTFYWRCSAGDLVLVRESSFFAWRIRLDFNSSQPSLDQHLFLNLALQGHLPNRNSLCSVFGHTSINASRLHRVSHHLRGSISLVPCLIENLL